MMWQVLYFQTARGAYPVKDFMLAQEDILMAKMEGYIVLLEENGPFLQPPIVKKLNDNLFELRIRGNKQIRILYTVMNQQFWLLHAFIKKTKKTPSKELKIALARKAQLI